MGSAVAGILIVLVSALMVWLKIVRPVRGDVEWSRQAKRLARAKAKRLARRREKLARA